MKNGRDAFPALDLASAPSRDELAALAPNPAEMDACIQDPVHHAEGSCWKHVAMTCEALARDPGFLSSSPGRRETLSWAALLHDVAKPATRSEERDPVDGTVRVRHPSHAPKGAVMAHAHLYRLGAPAALRTAVHALVDGHQAVFHLMSQDDWEDRAARRSLSRPWTDQIALARADVLGRICADARASLDGLELVEMAVRELGCLDGPHGYASPQARVAAGRGGGRHREPPEPRGSRVTVLVGLPGVGKDTYVAEHLADVPAISFDAVRREMGFEYGDRDGRALQETYERARVRLRAREPFT